MIICIYIKTRSTPNIRTLYQGMLIRIFDTVYIYYLRTKYRSLNLLFTAKNKKYFQKLHLKKKTEFETL